MTRNALVITILLALTTLAVDGQIKHSDTLKNTDCGTTVTPFKSEINYAGLVTMDNKPVANLLMKFCLPYDTTITMTDDSGLFKTMLIIDNNRKTRTYPKIVIENKGCEKYEFQITELYLDTLNYPHIKLIRKKK